MRICLLPKLPTFIAPELSNMADQNSSKFREMKISKKELANAKVPLHLRDYCAHLMVPLLECRRNTYFLPWKCKHERHEWEVCEYTDFLMRQRDYQNQKRK